MKTAEIIVTNSGSGMQDALALTERLGVGSGLDLKQILRLRLLAEELFGMFRSIVGQAQANYWAEQEDMTFRLHLKSDVRLTQERRRELLAASSAGENSAARTFTGKIRDMITTALLPEDDNPTSLSVGLMSLGSPGGYRAGSDYYDWSMKKYIEEVRRDPSAEGEAAEARDELERSVIARIADDVSVSIVGSSVEITIVKKF